MGIAEIAAIVYAVATAAVVGFQLALALGAPWGEYSMGGRFPGTYPPGMRVVATLNALFLVLLALVVLARAGLLLPEWSGITTWLIWGVVAFSAVSFVMNMITPSAGERLRWAPTTFVLLVTSLVVALTAT